MSVMTSAEQSQASSRGRTDSQMKLQRRYSTVFCRMGVQSTLRQTDSRWPKNVEEGWRADALNLDEPLHVEHNYHTLLSSLVLTRQSYKS